MAASSSGGASPLGVLLTESVNYAKLHWQTIVVGAVVFGVVMGLLSFSLGASALSKVSNSIGMDAERMADLGQRVQQGDEAAIDEMEKMINEKFGNKSDEEIAKDMNNMGKAMAASFLPTFRLGMLVSLLVFFLANAYYMLVAVEGTSLNAMMNRLPSVLLPLVGVSVWSFLRSFVWIPIIGIIPAIILGPRFIAAPVILLTEKKGIMQSVSESYTRTRGYWGKIVGNAIVAGLCLGIAAWIVNIVLGIILGWTPMLLLMVVSIVGQCIMGVMSVFAVRLSHTILQHPRA